MSTRTNIGLYPEPHKSCPKTHLSPSLQADIFYSSFQTKIMCTFIISSTRSIVYAHHTHIYVYTARFLTLKISFNIPDRIRYPPNTVQRLMSFRAEHPDDIWRRVKIVKQYDASSSCSPLLSFLFCTNILPNTYSRIYLIYVLSVG
jgi:hypothetical protein